MWLHVCVDGAKTLVPAWGLENAQALLVRLVPEIGMFSDAEQQELLNAVPELYLTFCDEALPHWISLAEAGIETVMPHECAH